MKPIKRGYKVWCRADSATGYLVQFQIYKGKDATWPANLTLGEHVILSLSTNVQAGSQLFFDDFFTTMRLLDILSEKGILATGTVRMNCKDMPPTIKVDKLKKGEHLWWSKRAVTAYQ